MHSVAAVLPEEGFTDQSHLSTAAYPQIETQQIEISFDDLSEFEIVQSQYSAWGIHFDRAIAVQPNNASFQTDRIGIMPVGDPMQITIAFELPTQRIHLLLTGASWIHATLLDANHRPLMQPLSQRLPRLPDSVSAIDAAEPLPFPQYELNLNVIDHPDKTIASEQLHSFQIDQVKLQSASPFVLQWMAIELSAAG